MVVRNRAPVGRVREQLPSLRYKQMKNSKSALSSSTCTHRARAAFTLIELLVVIAIIGILAGILIPAVGAVRESSNSAACVSNLRQITAASLLYANEHQGTLPSQGAASSGSSTTQWFHKIAPSLGAPDDITDARAEREVEVYACPSALAKYTPGSHPDNNQIRTYGMNYRLSEIGLSIDANGQYVFPGMRMLKAVNPAETAFFMDGHMAQPAIPYWHGNTHPHGMIAAPEDNFVHKGLSINVAYLDGHVGSVLLEEFPELGTVFWDPLATR